MTARTSARHALAALAAVSLLTLVVAGRLDARPLGSSAAAAVAAGNAAYQRGDFAAAERDYRRAFDGGATGPTVSYNLGNACFKQRKLGEAIFWWEKARRVDPEDADVRENLEFARQLVVDRIEVPPDPFPVRVLRSASHLLPERTESWLLVSLLAAANGCFALWLFAERRRPAAAALFGLSIAVFAAMLIGASLAWKVAERSSLREGVVIEQKVDIRSGPGDENTVLFSVHEGTVVRVRGEAGRWLQVSLPNGWNGWLKAEAVKR